MKFGSVCSGIEAASVAWHPLGWQAAWFAEIEHFPCAVLAHHYPTVPNLGDMTTIAPRVLKGEVEAPDVLAGGTPCQAFSVAGRRESLADERGNLTLKFVELADAIDFVRVRDGRPPAIVFWENVPGVLSTKDNAFGCFLGALAGESCELQPAGGRWANAGLVLGPRRAVAWRILDAQYFGLAQRRRRVFVVASARGGFDPATVLFEFDGLRRDTPPSREAGEGAAAGAGACAEGGRGAGTYACGGIGAYTSASASATLLKSGQDFGPGCETIITMANGQGGAEIGFDRGPTLTCNHEAPIAAYSTSGAGYWREGVGALRGRPQDSHENVCCVTGDVTYTLKAEGLDASEDGTERGQPIVVHGTQDPCTSTDTAFAIGRNSGQENAIAFSCKDYGADAGPLSPTLRSMGHDGSHANAGGQVAIAFNARQDPDHGHDRTGPLDTDGGTQAVAFAIQAGALRTNPSSGPDGVGVQADHAYTLEARAEVQAVAFAQNSRDEVREMPYVGALAAEPGMKQTSYIRSAMQVRRLTPRECARLQGFQDDYLDILYRGKAAADGPKYKALGNSWAVPVVRWIGERIQEAA